MAYNKSKGKQKHGDVIYDKDTDTQIDFEQNEIKFRTGGTIRASVTNDGLSVTGSAEFVPPDGGYLKVDDGGTDGFTKILGAGKIAVEKNSDTAITDPTFSLRRSRGNSASKTAVQDGDEIGSILFAGYDGSGGSGDNEGFGESAAIVVQADGEHGTSGDATDTPGKILFKTSPDGSSTVATRMAIGSDGKVAIGGDVASSGSISGTVLSGSSTATLHGLNVGQGVFTVSN